MRLLRMIGGLDVTGQERAVLNKLTMPANGVLLIGRQPPSGRVLSFGSGGR